MIEEHRGAGRHDDLLRPIPPDQDTGGWMISYIDIMTLLVALLVLIIALGRIGVGTGSMPGTPASRPAAETEGAPNMLGVPLPEPLRRVAAHESIPAPAGRLAPPAIAAALGVAGLPRRVPSPSFLPVRPTGPSAEEVGESAIAGARFVAESLQGAPYLADLEGMEVSRIPEGVRLRVEDRLLFPTAEAELTDEGRDLVTGRLRELVERHSGEVAVEGHSDSRPISTDRFPSNWALSSARAIAIVEALVAAGVEPTRLRAVGLADTRPLASNDSAAGRARNRRVEVTIQTR